MKNTRTQASWKVLKCACKEVRTATDDIVHAHLERFLTSLAVIYKVLNVRDQDKHLKRSVGHGGGLPFIKDENGVLLRNKGEILNR